MIGRSIWWEWRSPVNEMVTVSSCESGFPTLFAIFEGTELGDGCYEPGTRGGPLVEPPSGEGRVTLRIEPSVLRG